MSKLVNIILRELEIKDLEDYLFWSNPSHEYHNYNGPYYKQRDLEELRKYIEELRVLLLKGKENVLENKKIIADKDTDKIVGLVNWYWKSRNSLDGNWNCYF